MDQSKSDEKLRFSKLKNLKFPQTIEGFGYKFNNEGYLLHIDTGAPFEFQDRPNDRAYNQARYDALGEVIADWIEVQLEERFGLQRKFTPFDKDVREDWLSNKAFTYIFVSEDVLTNTETLLVLLQGSGVVRPGQWARSAIINDGLQVGSMFPYIERAKRNGWAIVILNPNENSIDTVSPHDSNQNKKNRRKSFLDNFFRRRSSSEQAIPGSESPENHCNYVWDQLMVKVPARKIVMVAHSYGGVCAVNMANRIGASFCTRVVACAFTDSVHSARMANARAREWLKERGRDWVRSDWPLDKVLPSIESNFFGCPCVSAGDKRHAYTSGAARDSVMDFLEEKVGLVPQ